MLENGFTCTRYLIDTSNFSVINLNFSLKFLLIRLEKNWSSMDDFSDFINHFYL